MTLGMSQGWTRPKTIVRAPKSEALAHDPSASAFEAAKVVHIESG